ncbi:Sulfotransferase [Nannochloropsis gaditana]|uniref:Sulfotransferase n=1 Tax=Nannochloropsis gaditana TaxID=72520 RepID=W7TH38_9STRA|nr:Sulfotransferase [Nannochloropsis gaditana]
MISQQWLWITLSFSILSYAWLLWCVVPLQEAAIPVIRFSAPSHGQGPVNPISSNATKSRSIPTFIHIPKTGGSSIETALSHRGIYVGRQAFSAKDDRSQRKYPIKQGHCSEWHSLPLEHIDSSITVVRDPVDRLLSEFCWERGLKSHRADLSCEGLSDWILHALSNIIADTNEKYDCHFIPQWEFAQWVDSIIPFCALGTPHGNKLLAEHFEIANFTMGRENESESHDRECKDFIKIVEEANVTSCISPTAHAMIQHMYRFDYEYLGKYFTCA